MGQIVLNGLGYNTPKPPGDGMPVEDYDKMVKENKEKAKIIAEMKEDDAKAQAESEAQVLGCSRSCCIFLPSMTPLSLSSHGSSSRRTR